MKDLIARINETETGYQYFLSRCVLVCL